MLKAEVLKADVPVSTLFISDARAPRHSRGGRHPHPRDGESGRAAVNLPSGKETGHRTCKPHASHKAPTATTAKKHRMYITDAIRPYCPLSFSN